MTSCPEEMEKIKTKARSLLVVVSTPPTENYGNFTAKVKEYNAKEPFNFMMPPIFHRYEKVTHRVALIITVKVTLFENIFSLSQ